MAAAPGRVADHGFVARMALIEIAVGVITRAHGVRGEVTVDLRTDEPERRFTPGAVLRAEPGSGRNPAAAGLTFTVLRTREHQGRWLVTFAEIGDRTAAEAVRGIRLVADVPDDETPTGEDEFYDRQLIGLAVVVEGGTEPFGTVRSVLHLPAQDVFEIETADGVRLVPFVSDLVPDVDLQAGRIVVTDVAGLLTDEAGEPADQPAPGSQT